jgi:hypothetical protein
MNCGDAPVNQFLAGGEGLKLMLSRVHRPITQTRRGPEGPRPKRVFWDMQGAVPHVSRHAPPRCAAGLR